jgi:hypothetical protein
MPSAGPSSRGTNSSKSSASPLAGSTPAPAAGRRRSNAATAPCLRAAPYASTRSHAQTKPSSSSSVAPSYRSPSPAASPANWASTTPPGGGALSGSW